MTTNLIIKINVEQISKHKLYKGNKGTYLDAVIIVYEEPDKFGYSGLIVEKTSEAEFKAGKKSRILGNMRYMQKKEFKPENFISDLPDDLPF